MVLQKSARTGEGLRLEAQLFRKEGDEFDECLLLNLAYNLGVFVEQGDDGIVPGLEGRDGRQVGGPWRVRDERGELARRSKWVRR